MYTIYLTPNGIYTDISIWGYNLSGTLRSGLEDAQIAWRETKARVRYEIGGEGGAKLFQLCCAKGLGVI